MRHTIKLCEELTNQLGACSDSIRAIHPENVTPVLFDQFKRAFVKSNDAHILNLHKLKAACKMVQSLTADLNRLAGIDQ